MPSISLQLLPLGPVIDTVVGLSGPRTAAMTRAGLTIPPLVNCRLLIDTGSSYTFLDSSIIAKLGMEPNGIVDVRTLFAELGHEQECRQYDVSLTILHPETSRCFNAIPIVESRVAHPGIDGLLGRDVLDHCLFVYHGELRVYTLSF